MSVCLCVYLCEHACLCVCVCLASEPSHSPASHRRVRGAYWKINGVSAKQVTGRCGKEGFLLIKQDKAFDVALGTCSLMGEPL